MSKHKKIHLLIDGDISYHRAARRRHKCGTQVTFNEARDGMDQHIDKVKEKLNADKVTLVLSGDPGTSFRQAIFPHYKGGGDGSWRPQLLNDCKQHLIDHHETLMIDGLEADDILGIKATEPQDEEHRIIVTIDKDLMQIPGNHFNQDDWHAGEFKVTQEEGDLQFYTQWLTGDSTDTYYGLPGYGPKKTKDFIFRIQEEHAREAQGFDYEERLEKAIVDLYRDHMLPAEYAILQARLARILRYGEFEEGKAKLWTPKWL